MSESEFKFEYPPTKKQETAPEEIMPELSVEDIEAADAELAAEMTTGEQVETSEDIEEGLDENFEDNRPDAKKTAERQAAERLAGEYQKKFEAWIEELDTLYAEGKHQEAQKRAEGFIAELRASVGEEFAQDAEGWFAEYDALQKQTTETGDPSKAEKLKNLAIEAVDFIPVVGPLKMITEGAKGRTFSGDTLKGSARLMHTASGAVFLGIDLLTAGIGGAVAKGGAGAAKIFTRSAALLRKMGMSRKTYTAVFKTGRFIAHHPAVAKVAEKTLNRVVTGRAKRQTDWIKGLPNRLRGNSPEETEQPAA